MPIDGAVRVSSPAAGGNRRAATYEGNAHMTEVTAHHGLLRNVKLHVEDTGGPGRPVVLIHGWPLSGESWKYQVPVLAQAGYRVITYDRRGFGRSDKPKGGYGYDTLADDLFAVLSATDARDATLVGFSMGGGEAARYFSRHGGVRLRSVVFAASVTPHLLQSSSNPEGPLTSAEAAKMAAALTVGEDSFYGGFMAQFLSAGGRLTVTEDQRRELIGACRQASKAAALACLASFGATDFTGDLAKVRAPALILHGDSDGVVPFAGSGRRTHAAIAGSEVHLIAGAPHGCNISHPAEFNQALLDFLAK
jgi:pimeloyl-ACP methyl ester carboxylesterase